MSFTTPSADLANKSNINPSNTRSQEATAEDFIELCNLIVELQLAVSALQASESPNPFYGTFTSMAALMAAHPVGVEDAWAIIDEGAGVTPKIAIWDVSDTLWEIEAAISPILAFANVGSLPNPGASDTLYITLNDFAIYFYSGGSYQLLSKPPSFLNLTDTPSGYTSHQFKLLRINAAGNAIEFVSQDDIFTSVRKAKVIDIVDNTAAPPTEVTGDRYILDNTGSSHADWDGANAWDIVEFDGTDWISFSPEEGWTVYVDEANLDAVYVDDGTGAWELRFVPITDTISIFASDLETNLETGEKDLMFAPYAFELSTYWIGALAQVPTGSALTVDIKKNGVSIPSTPASIDDGEATSLTGTQPTLTTTTFAKGDKISINITNVGSTEPGKGLEIFFEITKI